MFLKIILALTSAPLHLGILWLQCMWASNMLHFSLQKWCQMELEDFSHLPGIPELSRVY